MRGALLARVVVLALAVALGDALAAGAQHSDRDALVAQGRKLFSVQGCYGCHLVGGFGTAIGPDLSHVGSKFPEEYFSRWLRDPAMLRPSAHMPKLELEPSEVRALAAWLTTLK